MNRHLGTRAVRTLSRAVAVALVSGSFVASLHAQQPTAAPADTQLSTLTRAFAILTPQQQHQSLMLFEKESNA